MAAGVFLTYVSPLGFIVLGALAGVVMIAQMAFLAGVSDHQGLLMGLFSTASYLGMAILPFLAGVIADTGGFPGSICRHRDSWGNCCCHDRVVRVPSSQPCRMIPPMRPQ